MAALGRVRLSPWLVAMAAVHILLGGGPEIVLGLGCVFLHEMGHAAAAAAMGAGVESVEIAPFGGVARLRGLERMSPLRAAGIALAGPLTSLLLAAACGALAYALPGQAVLLAQGIRLNGTLLLFNLLPAYPMDGGRVLCALIQRRAGYVRAQRITAGMGLGIGILTMLAGVISVRYVGKVNLTLLLAGGYLCAAAGRARRETPYSYLQMLLGRERDLDRRRMLPVRTVAVRAGTADAEVLAHLQPGALYRVVYLDGEMRVRQEKWESELLHGGADQ